MKTFLLIFAILIVALIIALAIGFTDISRDEIDIKNIVWRLPEPSEKKRIEKTFLMGHVDSCNKYYVKKVMNNQFIVACSQGSKWNYYRVFTDQKRVFPADEDIVAELTAPVNVKEETSPPLIKDKNFQPERGKGMVREAK